eukprot:scaffold1384_cov116-Cylindrotheca_fusiformis.AAC.4
MEQKCLHWSRCAPALWHHIFDPVTPIFNTSKLKESTLCQEASLCEPESFLTSVYFVLGGTFCTGTLRKESGIAEKGVTPPALFGGFSAPAGFKEQSPCGGPGGGASGLLSDCCHHSESISVLNDSVRKSFVKVGMLIGTTFLSRVYKGGKEYTVSLNP